MWRINPETNIEHPAPFPEEISDKLIQYYSFKNDIVLDPFMGSGTVAVSSKNFSRRYIGFEKNEDFCDLARRRASKTPTKKITDYFIKKNSIDKYFK